MTSLIGALEARGLVAQVSDRDGLDRHLADGRRTLYCGFDPSAPSLQVGNLVPLMVLRRYQLAGHRPIALVGGATGLIGDPSGRDEERSLNDDDTVAGWTENIRRQVSRFIDLDGDAGLVVNNLDWMREQDAIGFLRDVGKHFSVNAMLARDAVRARIDREGAGISFTEFSYMLLQAFDFAELARRHDCTLQVAGNDQWGNIASGIDLGRRLHGRRLFGMTSPLVTRADGVKFGKSAGGAVWLDAEHTSPYAFHQFWLNCADADVVPFLGYFTVLPTSEIDEVAAEVRAHPERRQGQRALAAEVTRLVHGEAALQSADRIAKALFGGDVRTLTEDDLGQLELDGMERTSVPDGTGLLDALTSAGLTRSNGEARRMIAAGAVHLNGSPVADAALRLTAKGALHGRHHLLRRGKKRWHLMVLQQG
ncbi:MAG: tyrosine--tRNA ligase [Gammaproteobacteria bacterium]|nr:tyrosine--tRNA ligase [Gammaproteobacteria bacterium]